MLTFVWFYSTKNSNQPAEVALADVVAKIEKREVKEVNFSQSRVDLTDNEDKKFFASVGSDATRERVLQTVKTYNETNFRNPIKYNEEPVSSGFGWLILINALPFLMFFIMWAATLAVIIYAVRTLSRNKS